MSQPKKRKPVKAKSALRRQRKNGENPVIPLCAGATIFILILIVVLNAGKNKSQPTQKADRQNSAESSEVEVSEKRIPEIKPNKSSIPQEVEFISYNNAEELLNKNLDDNELRELRLEIHQYILERNWDDADSLISEYEDKYPAEMMLAKREVQMRRNNAINSSEESNTDQQIARKNNNGIVPAVKAQGEEKNEEPKKLVPLAPKKNDGRGPNGFLYETELDRRRQARGNPPVKLLVHSKKVGLPENVIVVWKDRTHVLSYSRLIKKLENEKSKFYKKRVEDAKQFLKQHQDQYGLIEFAKASMSLRRQGFTVSEVFFNESTPKDEYGESETSRYKGYIISYDLKPDPRAFIIRC